MRRVTALICLLTFFLGISHADPVITNVSGTLIDGGTVLVSGSGFGAQGSTIQIYDNFEGGIAGNDVDLSPVVGSWLGYGTFIPKFDGLGYSGNLSMRVHDGDGRFNQRIIKTSFPPTNEIFVSYWMQIPTGHTFPGHDTPGLLPTGGSLPPDANQASTWKLVWMFDGDNGTGDNDVVMPTYVDGELSVSGNNTSRIGDKIRLTNPSIADQSASIFKFGEWIRITVWLKGPPAPDNTDVANLGPGESKFTYAIPTSDINIILTSTDPVFDDDATKGGPEPPFQWTHINFTGFTGNGVPSTRWGLTRPLFDEVYLATGPGAQARIEICDQPLYEDCGRFGFITVDPGSVGTDWTETGITGVIRRGALSPLEIQNGAFIYVYDENGLVNPTGFPICGACPRPPTNLQVN